VIFGRESENAIVAVDDEGDRGIFNPEGKPGMRRVFW
jgi:hypothetical protein